MERKLWRTARTPARDEASVRVSACVSRSRFGNSGRARDRRSVAPRANARHVARREERGVRGGGVRSRGASRAAPRTPRPRRPSREEPTLPSPRLPPPSRPAPASPARAFRRSPPTTTPLAPGIPRPPATATRPACRERERASTATSRAASPRAPISRCSPESPPPLRSAGASARPP